MTHLMIGVGEVEVGEAVIDGRHIIRVVITDSDGADKVDLTFGIEHFVTVADHLKMAADHFVSRIA